MIYLGVKDIPILAQRLKTCFKLIGTLVRKKQIPSFLTYQFLDSNNRVSLDQPI